MTEDTKKAVSNLEQKPHNPFAGCFLIAFTILVFIGLIVFSIIAGVRQNNAIDEFADSQSLSLSPIVFDETLKTKTTKQLSDFANLVNNNQPATLTLGVDEINRLFFMYPEGEELRDTFRIVSISPTLLEATLSMKMNTLNMPWEEKAADRFLNVRLFAEVKISDGELFLAINEAQSVGTGKKIPEAFVANFDPYRIMLKYKEHPQIAPVMLALTRVEQSSEGVSLVYDPNAPTPGVDELPDNPLEVNSIRILLAISVVFTFFLTVYLLWSRYKKGK